MNTTKNVIFDLVATQPNASGKRHGGGKYGEIIFFRMVERGIQFSAYYDSRIWLNPKVQAIIEENRIPLFDIAKESLEEIVTSNKFDKIYSALPNTSLRELNTPEVIRIGTQHGIRAIETPIDHFFWKYKNPLREQIRYALFELFPKWRLKKGYKFYNDFFTSGIDFVVVSNHTYSSIKSYFPQYKKDLPIFYSPNTSSPNQVEKHENIIPYFLMVSGNRWEKNNLRAIIAFDRLVSSGLIKGMQAVITGCSPENFRYKIQNPEHFIFHGYVEENVLEDLYANAYAFVYPSLNEGFGYPPLEAMRYGVPVIASPFSSISDVLEGAALYFNPFSIEEIMSRMLLIMDEKRHKQYVELGLQRYKLVKQRQDADLDAIIDYIIS